MHWSRALILAAALTIGVGGAPTTGSTGAESLPVRWSASLGLASLDQLERRQRQPLWDADGILLARKWRFTASGKAPEPVEPRRVVSCRDYWATDRARYRTPSQSEHNLLAAFGAACTALKALGFAKPSRLSFVAEFRLDAAAADVLPAAIAIAVTPARRRALEKARARDLSWRKLRAAQGAVLLSVRGEADGAVIFEWTRGKSRVEITARGDFNGDGAADLLLRIGEWPGYGHAAKSKALLVTRWTREAAMRTLPWPWEAGEVGE